MKTTMSVERAEKALERLLVNGGSEREIIAAYVALEVDAAIGMSFPKTACFADVAARLDNAAEVAPRGLRQRKSASESRRSGRRALIGKARGGCLADVAIGPTYDIPVKVWREEGEVRRWVDVGILDAVGRNEMLLLADLSAL